MRAIIINEFGGRDKLQLADVPLPEIKEDEILVAVKAAGVNPVDYKAREGYLRERLPHQFPVILGWDAAGIVERIGTRVTTFKAGDEVYAYCRKPVVQYGAYAEYIALPAVNVALKPKNMTMEEAATVPLTALTAYQALFDKVKLQKNEIVLIHAAAGGVGTFAVQMAKKHGARVLGTASGKNHDYLRAMGVDEPIDYTAGDFLAAVHKIYQNGVDAVLDSIGGETLSRSAKILKKGGRIVSLLDEAAVKKLKMQGIKASYLFVSPNAEQLSKIAKMIENGSLRTSIFASFPLAEAARAHELMEQGHVVGKIVLKI